MIGFVGPIAAQRHCRRPVQIADAHWFSADAMPLIPPKMSIARLLIDDWLRRQGRQS